MKTNQEMIRKMGEFSVTQRTSDSYFNATALLKQWNEKFPNEQRRLDKFWDSTNLGKLMNEITKNEMNFTSPNFGELKNKLSVNSKARSDRGGGTWMHPILFVKFAMYLSASFEYSVIKFIADEMIKYRNDAGDAYRNLATSIGKIVHPDFMPKAMCTIGEALNWVVFNCHEKAVRNKFGDEKLQKELWLMERKVSELIEDGFIRNYEDLMNYLRRQYQKRNNPKVFNDNQ